ncbi:MAG: glycosyltransferase [Bacteroidia bacterium]|nr:glycosyltransferase [Bacteroidia bacterium]
MKLTVVIVSYNVKHFLDQCLYSLFRSLKNVDAEVYVVDNASVDQSARMVMEKYRTVKVIANKENLGFSRANNQALRIAEGEYVLLLNPDTVLQDDTIEKCLQFMDNHPEAGALGVRMVDGKGNFLPESKRGFPSPWNSFCKMFGLSALFPKIKIFGGYHLSYLDPHKNHEVDILSGAFMLIRSAALEKAGLLDEDFFMYGEDIDLSYRIKKAGYKNYYFAQTSIIHYKGESTKKGSLNYVRVFYQAMLIFIRKHFSGNKKNIFIFFIYCAIFLRAFMALAYRFFQFFLIYIIDFFSLLLMLIFISQQYAVHVKNDAAYFPEDLLYKVFPVYVLLNVVSLFFNGAYDSPVLMRRILRGVASAQVAAFIIYALLPETMRFSRIILLIAPLVTIFWFLASRWIYHVFGIYEFYTGEKHWMKDVLVVADTDEFERVKQILSNPSYNLNLLGFISTSEKNCSHPQCLGNVGLLKEIVKMFGADEIIFCPKDVPPGDIIRWMTEWASLPIEVKIAPPESVSIIGSSHVDRRGDLYLMEYNYFSRPENRRKKYFVDVALALVVMSCMLYLTFVRKNFLSWFRACIAVISGKYTWFGSPDPAVPWFKPSVFPVTDELQPHDAARNRVRFMYYIRNYSPSLDVKMLFEKMKTEHPFSEHLKGSKAR